MIFANPALLIDIKRKYEYDSFNLLFRTGLIMQIY